MTTKKARDVVSDIIMRSILEKGSSKKQEETLPIEHIRDAVESYLQEIGVFSPNMRTKFDASTKTATVEPGDFKTGLLMAGVSRADLAALPDDATSYNNKNAEFLWHDDQFCIKPHMPLEYIKLTFVIGEVVEIGGTSEDVI